MADGPKSRKKQKQKHTTGVRAKTLQVACGLCRQRKTKCDGGRPSCDNCLDKGEACAYETLENESRSEAMRREIEALQSRNERLEAEQAEYTASSSHPRDNPDTAFESDIASDGAQARATSTSTCHTNQPAIDLLHAMATESDQDASMLFAKLRSGYTWEELAEEVQRGWRSGPYQASQSTLHDPMSFSSTAMSNDLGHLLDPALRRSPT